MSVQITPVDEPDRGDRVCENRGGGGVKQEILIRSVADASRREQIAARILHALPDWFGLPESTKQYIAECRSLPFWAGFDGAQAAGFLALKQTGPKAIEIHVMGILPEYHRRGVGRRLWQAAAAWAKREGYLYVQVKTVACGHYPEYDRTNAFYRAMGFEELECFTTLWDEWNPCQVYIKYIGECTDSAPPIKP